MLTIWGRTNSVNVQKVLWCLGELGLAFDRIDAGMQFGKVREPDFLALNPNGLVPMLQDGDFTLWESNAIIRYLTMEYGKDTTLYPEAPCVRASVDRWLDWSLSTLQPAERPIFIGYVRTPPEKRDPVALATAVTAAIPLWSMLDHHLASRTYLENESFTLADLVLGAFARRWLDLDGPQRPSMPALERWYATLRGRQAFAQHLGGPLT